MDFNMNIDNSERSAIAQVFLDVDPDLKPIHKFYLRRRNKWTADILRLKNVKYTIRAKDPQKSKFKDKELGWSLRTIKELYAKVVSTDEELTTLYFKQKLNSKLTLDYLSELLILHLLAGEPYLRHIQ